MSLEKKLRKPTQGQMPATVVDELAAQPPQEPANAADDHREQIINNLSDEDIPLPAAPHYILGMDLIQLLILRCRHLTLSGLSKLFLQGHYFSQFLPTTLI
jgi:hypothetical protein